MIPQIAIALSMSWPGSGSAGPEPAFHPGPPVVLEFDLRQDGVTIVLKGERTVLHPWLDLSVELEPEGRDAREAIAGALRSAFQTRHSLHVGGVRVVPRVDAVRPADEVDFGGLAGTRIEMSVPLEAAPEHVTLVWRATFDEQWNDEPMPVMFHCRGRFDWGQVSEAEPECSWHARGRERRVREVFVPEPVVHDLPTVPLPTASIGCALVGLLLLVLPGWGGGLRVGSLVVSLVAAVCLRSVGVIEIERPMKGVVVPDREEAIALFESLHRNVYSAFSAETEDELYERLARSFAGEILDEQYQDVFKSLVLRRHGGAVCQIEEIEVLERAVDFERAPPEVEPLVGEGPFYWVSWTWRVHCQVVHWGHRHRRMNHYEADYWVRHDGREWRIAAVEVRDSLRVDDDEDEWDALVGERGG